MELTWNLSGKRALVLGGTSGIGLATVRKLVAAGAQVTAGSRSPDRVSSARVTEPNAQFREIDVLDRSALEALFADLGTLDLLINCATGGERASGPFLSMDLDGFQGSFRKLWGYVNSVRLGASSVDSDGAIVLVSGSPARKAQLGMSAVSTVGNAVEGFARAIAPELAPRRIMVVAPGIIDTPMFGGSGDARTQMLSRATGNALIKRPGTPDEVADAILFAATNRYMTGSVIDVDGGILLP
jgi:NAD(P)-dependent dehydrogenase (short-subunit alcohol dehydrogenase family)